MSRGERGTKGRDEMVGYSNGAGGAITDWSEMSEMLDEMEAIAMETTTWRKLVAGDILDCGSEVLSREYAGNGWVSVCVQRDGTSRCIDRLTYQRVNRRAA